MAQGKHRAPPKKKKRSPQALLSVIAAALVLVALTLILPRFRKASTEAPGEATRSLPLSEDGELPPLDSYDVELQLEDGALSVSGTGAMPALYRELSEEQLASVETLELGQNLTSLDPDAFRGCTRLKELTLPEGLVSIGAGAFADCKLETIRIPASVTRIDEGAFRGCTTLREILVEEGNPSYVSADGVLLSSDGRLLLCYPGSREARGYRVPEGVTRIADHAFSGFLLKETLFIPASVTEIGPDALSRCYGLAAIKVNGDNPAFSAADGVLYDRDKRVLLRYPSGKTSARFSLPKSVEEIGPCAFCENYELSEAVLPERLSRIGRGAFSGCSFLKKINFPQSVTEIGEEAFLSCSRLTEIRLPQSLSSLGTRAFAYCYELQELTLPGGTELLGEACFQRCDMLRLARLEEGVPAVSAGMFRQCGELREVYLPQSVTAIGAEAFADCGALQALSYAGAQEQWASVAVDPAALPEGLVLSFGG